MTLSSINDELRRCRMRSRISFVKLLNRLTHFKSSVVGKDAGPGSLISFLSLSPRPPNCVTPTGSPRTDGVHFHCRSTRELWMRLGYSVRNYSIYCVHQTLPHRDTDALQFGDMLHIRHRPGVESTQLPYKVLRCHTPTYCLKRSHLSKTQSSPLPSFNVNFAGLLS
jgi:hypothetical protein